MCEERNWPAQCIIANPPFSGRQVSGVHLRPVGLVFFFLREKKDKEEIWYFQKKRNQGF